MSLFHLKRSWYLVCLTFRDVLKFLAKLGNVQIVRQVEKAELRDRRAA